MIRFSLIGCGFIADRHIASISHVGGHLVAACDIDPEKEYKANGAKFFTDYKEMLKVPTDYIVIATPNYLHGEMIKEASLGGLKIICEKPPVISRPDFYALKSYPDLSIVLQCRYSDKLKALKEEFSHNGNNEVEMKIEVHRDDWYMKSWKADPKKSGGLLYNIGCHYFDLLVWWFGSVAEWKMIKMSDTRCVGEATLNKAKVKWTVAIDAPIDKQKRIFKINGQDINLTQMGFENLHPKVYEEVLRGNGHPLREFEPTMDLIEKYAR